MSKSFYRQSPFWTMNPLLILRWANFILLRSLCKAVQYFKTTAEEQSEIGGVNVHQRLAESLSASGEFEDAIPWYEKAVDENPDPNTIFGYGFTALQAGLLKQLLSACLI